MHKTSKTAAAGPPVSDIAAVVVTCNRRSLLVRCTTALLQQHTACDIIIVDNASSDGTPEALRTAGLLERSQVHYRRLEKNLGGSGGFHHGLDYGMRGGWKWFWLMDDDGAPEPGALLHLMRHATDERHVYGSAAVGELMGQTRLSWPAAVLSGSRPRLVESPERLAELQAVNFLPFIGFLIHRNLVDAIGLPDPQLFIRGDDLEYCERAKKAGAGMFQVKSSVIRHPVAARRIVRFAGREILYRSSPPWKFYYEVRNKVVIAKRHHGPGLWFKTLPGVLLRASLAVFTEKQPLEVLRMHVRGITDGLRSRLGRRIQPKPNGKTGERI